MFLNNTKLNILMSFKLCSKYFIESIFKKLFVFKDMQSIQKWILKLI